ncbi:hypothetical protein N9N67_01865 [Bacteriovoracaceae bacterium]|nr:hypothetical protein [Bacteriovoracaceae bacterium]
MTAYLDSFYHICSTYLLAFLHPIRIHDYYLYNIPLPGNNPYPEKLDLSSSLMCSWFCVFFGNILNLFITVIFYFNLIDQGVLSYFSLMGLDESYLVRGLYFVTFSSLVDVIFFPLFNYLYIEFYTFILKFFAEVLGDVKNKDEKINDIINTHFSSYLLGIIPVLGKTLYTLYSAVLIYIGIRKQFKAGRLVSFFILFFPVILVIFTVLSMLTLLFSLI